MNNLSEKVGIVAVVVLVAVLLIIQFAGKWALYTQGASALGVQPDIMGFIGFLGK